MTQAANTAGQSGDATAGGLVAWLAGSALPLWHRCGRDGTGGFFEALGLDGSPLHLPRRVRVPPRQLYVFCHGKELGWPGDVGDLAQRGVDAMRSRFCRPDGFYRTLVSDDGRVLDDAALLYDQAFVLLGLAAAAGVSANRSALEQSARALRENIARHWQVAPGQFRSGEAGDAGGDRREANPHMHLLEACLAWSAIAPDPAWRDWAGDLVRTAQERFVDATTGALFETFDGNWRMLADLPAHAVEPGHQYEWAWLLLRAQTQAGTDCRATALRLIDVAETYGVRDGVAVNGLDARLGVRDANARLWVQTERLRACTVAYRQTGVLRYRSAAAQAMEAITPFLRMPVPGLWLDERTADGEHRATVVHASTLYHLVSAARELA